MSETRRRKRAKLLLVGSIVRLKSGGPKMTVRKLGNMPSVDPVECQWFNEGKAEWNIFPQECLREAHDGKRD